MQDSTPNPEMLRSKRDNLRAGFLVDETKSAIVAATRRMGNLRIASGAKPEMMSESGTSKNARTMVALKKVGRAMRTGLPG